MNCVICKLGETQKGTVTVTLERVQFLLEDTRGKPIDLVTEKATREELRPYIEQEAINV